VTNNETTKVHAEVN